ncbi:MAG: hypothetical protein ACOYN3_08345 [Acidimicrobiia bacterium]
MRRFFAFVCSFVGLTCLVGAVLGITANLTVLHRPTVDTVATAALKSTSVQQRLSDEIAVAVLKAMPAAGRTQPAETAIRQTATTLAKDPAMRPLWLGAVRQLYDNAVNGTNNAVTLDATELTQLVRSALAASNPQLVALLPGETTLQVQVTGITVPNLKPIVRLLRWAPYALLGAGIALFVVAIAVSPNHRRAARRIGWWTFVVGAVITTAVLLGPRLGLPRLGSPYAGFAPAVNGIGWRLYVPAAALTGVGFLLAMIGTIITARAPENRITRSTQTGPTAVQGHPSVEMWDTRV